MAHMVIEPVVSCPESEKYYLLLSGEKVIFICFTTLPEGGLDEIPLFHIGQIFFKLDALCTFFGQFVSSFISWNATVCRDPLKGNSVGYAKVIKSVTNAKRN